MTERQLKGLQGQLVEQWPALNALLEAEDFELLWRERYRNDDSIHLASAEELRRIGLPSAIVTTFKPCQAGTPPSI